MGCVAPLKFQNKKYVRVNIYKCAFIQKNFVKLFKV